MDRMKRHEGPQTPYEVYCYHCRVTAAMGTSRCVHCGGRLSGRAQRGAAAVVTELPDGDAPQRAAWLLESPGSRKSGFAPCGESGS